MTEKTKVTEKDVNAEKASIPDKVEVGEKTKEMDLRETVIKNLQHNAEVEACDLLIENDQLNLLVEHVEEITHGRVCIYLLRYNLIFVYYF